MAGIKLTNFAFSTLAVGISNSATTLSVQGGHGARFPVLGVGDYFYATLENSSLQREIIRVTARTVDSFTIVRGQDNTTAMAWLAGDSVALRLNAAAFIDASGTPGDGLVTPAKLSTGGPSWDTSGNVVVFGTGSLDIPSGTTAQRPSTPNSGMIRYNADLGAFEGYGTGWGALGGGATGGAGNPVFYENDQTVTANYTITTGKNAMSAGPVTINNTIVVTIPTGSVWTIV